MKTAGNTGTGAARGRGLDAFFQDGRDVAPSVPDIDPDLAAMLDKEVRAGAPSLQPVDDAPRSTDIDAPPVLYTHRTIPASAPYPADISLPGGARPVVRDAGSAPPGDDGIDVPAPVMSGPTPGPVSPVSPAPIISDPVVPPPVVNPTPITPLPTTPPVTPPVSPPPPATNVGGVASTGVEQPPASPIRIGAVIIDSTTTSSSATAGSGGAALTVGPAGELIPASGGGAQLILPGQRDVMPPITGSPSTAVVIPPPPQLTDSQQIAILDRLNEVMEPGWQKTLHQQIDNLYKQVATEFSTPIANADHMLTLLQEARQILIESPANYVAAEYRMVQVRTQIARTTESREQARTYAPRILGYQVGWLAVFLLGLVFAAPLTAFFTRSGSITGATANDLFPFWNTLMWGGVGGIVGALYALWWHVSDQQDFDRQHMMWYLVQPIMGLVLGGIVFLLLSGGFLLLEVKPTDTNAGARLVPYLIAVLAGFRQNFVYAQLDRLMALFTPAGTQSNGKNKPS